MKRAAARARGRDVPRVNSSRGQNELGKSTRSRDNPSSDQTEGGSESGIRETELSPEAVKAWCDELRLTKSRLAFIREELPSILAESGEKDAAALRVDLDRLELHAAILEAWIISLGDVQCGELASKAAS
jgi:hypothetical protein